MKKCNDTKEKCNVTHIKYFNQSSSRENLAECQNKKKITGRRSDSYFIITINNIRQGV